MNRILWIILIVCNSVWANETGQSFDSDARKLLAGHYKQYKDDEYFSGISLSVLIPKQPIKNYYIGRVSHETDSEEISAQTLFQIGSITKSFTAAVVLQLATAGKLTLNDTLETWLPQYKKWSDVTLKQLLNMTSGLPNYSDTPLWNVEEAKMPTHSWRNEELISYVYPSATFSPPLKTGYFYSNTGYLLSDMIVEKAMHNPFANELQTTTIKRAGLENTFYPIPALDAATAKRMAHGYSYNQYDNPSLLGKDLSDNNLSWAAAAGALVSNSEDIIRWVNALFISNDILNSSEKAQLMSLVSTQTGKPIATLTSTDTHGFGLGVAQAFDDNKLLGHYWFYEGQTLGFRALYMYVPCNKIIISAVFNSSTNAENDKAGDLMQAVYKLILNQRPDLSCKKAWAMEAGSFLRRQESGFA